MTLLTNTSNLVINFNSFFSVKCDVQQIYQTRRDYQQVERNCYIVFNKLYQRVCYILFYSSKFYSTQNKK